MIWRTEGSPPDGGCVPAGAVPAATAKLSCISRNRSSSGSRRANASACCSVNLPVRNADRNPSSSMGAGVGVPDGNVGMSE